MHPRWGIGSTPLLPQCGGKKIGHCMPAWQRSVPEAVPREPQRRLRPQRPEASWASRGPPTPWEPAQPKGHWLAT
eukprot:14470998-Alexandrium_andersonii.AAC.1